MQDRMREFQDFVEERRANPVAVEAEFTAMQSKALLVWGKIKANLTEEEYKIIHKALSEICSLYIANAIPIPLSIVISDQLISLATMSALVGYYMGKTGDKLEGL